MRTPRIYQQQSLNIGETIPLDARAAHYVSHVLRLSANDPIILFNSHDGEFDATITTMHKHNVIVHIDHARNNHTESPLHIHLGQAISRGEKMDFTIQKSIELGVHAITPLFSERCNVQLSTERLNKRMQHWQAIAMSACEQCGRNYLPTIHIPLHIHEWINQCDQSLKLVLSPSATESLVNYVKKEPSKNIALLIGSEGGLTENEIAFANQHGFQNAHLGPRILRTETAALAAIAVLQSQCGDFQ